MSPGDEQVKSALQFEIYEVFAQMEGGSAHEHQFSLVADSPAMALTLARENFLRRRQVVSVWVVRRQDIVEQRTDDDLLYRLPKTYRETGDYRYLVEKWRKYGKRALTPDTMT